MTNDQRTRLIVSYQGRKLTVEQMGEIIGKLKAEGHPVLTVDMVQGEILDMEVPPAMSGRRNIEL